MTIPGQLNPSPRLLLGPGPSDAHPRVLSRMATPLLGHLDPQFLEIMNETQEMLRQRVPDEERAHASRSRRPARPAWRRASSTCSSRATRWSSASTGFFGNRMVDIAGRTGAAGDGRSKRPWGEVFDLDAAPRDAQDGAAEGARHRPRRDVDRGAGSRSSSSASCATSSTRCSSSTAVTSLGCVPVKLDEWEIDARLQLHAEGAELPAGAVAGDFSPRAVEAIEKPQDEGAELVPRPVASIQSYWGGDRVYHHTAPITHDLRPARGAAAACWRRGWRRASRGTCRNHRGAEGRACCALGLEYTAAEGHQLPQLNAVRIPDGVDDAGRAQAAADRVRHRDRRRPGRLQGQGVADGLMGYNSRPRRVLLVLAALEQCLQGRA